MHVLLIPSWYPNKNTDVAGVFFKEQAEALVKAGCKVGVITPQLRSVRKWRSVFCGGYGVTVDEINSVAAYRYHGINYLAPFTYFQSRRMKSIGRKLFIEYVKLNGQPDVIHAHGAIYGGIVAEYISTEFYIPYVLTEHSSAFGRNLLNKKKLKLAKCAATKASSRIAVSDALGHQLKKILGADGGSWEIIPNLVGEAFLNASLICRSAHKPFTFAHISMLNPNKNVESIINAFVAGFKNDEDVRLFIGGTGSEELRLQKIVKKFGADAQISFLGKLSREKTLACLSDSDCIVVSSRYETFSVILIEALALGKPVVATNCGGPASIVNKANGILVQVDDIQELSDAMKEIKNNYHLYDHRIIRRDCAERFSSKAVVSKILERYRSVLEKAHPGT